MKAVIITMITILLSGCGTTMHLERIRKPDPVEQEWSTCHNIKDRWIFYRGALNSLLFVGYGSMFLVGMGHSESSSPWIILGYPFIYAYTWVDLGASTLADTALIPYYGYLKYSCRDYDQYLAQKAEQLRRDREEYRRFKARSENLKIKLRVMSEDDEKAYIEHYGKKTERIL